MMIKPDPARFIHKNFPAAPVPGIPEILLHQAAPSSGLRRFLRGNASPYWAYRWGGGLALARHLLDNRDTVAGRRVLDLGAGSGLVGIAAAMAGALTVTAAEIDPYAVAALTLNLALNGVAAEIVHADLTTGPPPAVDLILVGDLFYEAKLAARVTRFLHRCAENGIAVLVGDPWRAHLPLDRLRERARYEVAESGSPAPLPTGVFVFLPERDASRRSPPANGNRQN
jgi:predicted nicotinamide N-methyase